MRIGILGPLDVRDEDDRPIEVGGPRLRALLIRLAVDAGRTVSAGRLIDDLWSGAPPAGAVNALQALVSRLRATGVRDAVESRAGGYRLAVDPGDVDAVVFDRLVTAARAEGDPARRVDMLRRALALWRGPALADVEQADFAKAPIVRLDESRVTAIEDRIDAEMTLGDPASLVPELDELHARHPLRERLCGQLMRALDAAGRQAEALTAYEGIRRALVGGLGVDPSPELAAVHLAILRRPEAPERDEVRTNLTAPLTSFVGRDKEIERVGALLGRARLVTLTGPGGAGKTRLASEAAGRLTATAPDGVWFVPLAPVRGALDVPQAVLSAVGIPEMHLLTGKKIARPLDRLTAILSGKRLILVLDNCEHLIDAVAELADRVLAAAPGIRVLATSREPLGITGESLCPVPSLALPPPDADATTAQAHDAVRLFADRAAAARPGFTVDTTTVGPVVRICRALDGVPLAIELAAARLRALTPAQVAERLDDRFRLLTVGSRTAMPRHQTLRAVVDWSWELLDEAERTVLRRLSVFNGGATLATAERILGEDVIDVIASLVDKSLVMATGDSEVRYRLLETVRAYAAERLTEAGEDTRMRDAHAAYFLELAERAEPELRRNDQLIWAERLGAESDNCNTALRHAIDTRDVTTALRLVAGLVWFWILRDYEAEAGTWAIEVWGITDGSPPPGTEDAYLICGFTAALVTEMSRDGGPEPDRLHEAMRRTVHGIGPRTTHPALAICAPLATLFAGMLDETEHELEKLADHPDAWVRAARQVFLAHLAFHRGRIDQAEEATVAGYVGFQEVGDRWGMSSALVGIAEVAMARGRPADAITAIEEAYGYAVEGVSPDQAAGMLIALGRARAMAGDIEGARADLDRGSRAARRIGEHSDAAGGLVLLAELARREGDLDEARALLGRAVALIEPRVARSDLGHASARVFSKRACLAEQEGDLVAAAGWHAEAMRSLARIAVLPVDSLIATLVEGFAALAAARDEHVRAAELLGTAHTLRGYAETWSLEVDRATSAALAALGREAFDAAYERGRRSSREAALALTP